MALESEKMEDLLSLAALGVSDEGWTELLSDHRVTLAHRQCPGNQQLMKFQLQQVAVKNPPENPSHLLVRPEVRAQYQEQVSPVDHHSFDLVEQVAPGEGLFWRWQQFGLLKLCCLLFGGSSGNSFFCTDTPTLAHHKLRRDFPRKGDCVVGGRLAGTLGGCEAVTEGIFITRPREAYGYFSVTLIFAFREPRWKLAAWAEPHILRLAHLGEKCIQWILNRPGIAELRALDEEHYVVLAVSCTKRGPPLLPVGRACARVATNSIHIQAGEALGISKWRRFGATADGSVSESFNLAKYVRDFMASLGIDLIAHAELDGNRLVYYQCAVLRREWSRVRAQFHEVFHVQKAAYRRANGGSNAPSLNEDAKPRFICNVPKVRTPDTGLPVQKVVVKRTFLENASDDESEGEELSFMMRAKSETGPRALCWE